MTVVWLRPPKRAPMAGQRRARVLAREVHGHLAGPGEACRAAGREELLTRETEGIGGDVLDRFDGQRGGADAGLPAARRVELVEDLGGEGAGRAGAR